MYQVAASLQAWPLHNGRLVHVREGSFLQPPGADSATLAASRPPAESVRARPTSPSGLLAGGAIAAVAAAVSSAVGIPAPPDQQAQQRDQQAASDPHIELGPSGRTFIERHLALFAIPWSIKLQLDVAGVTGLRTITPANLRPLLRRLGQQGGAGQAGGAFDAMGVQAAAELLEFCCGDLLQAAPQQAATAGAFCAKPTASFCHWHGPVC